MNSVLIVVAVLGGLTVVGVGLILVGLWLRATEENDEQFIARLREVVRAEVHDAGHESTTETRLATEDDALAWGFPADWMAAERVELFWASRRDRA